MYLRLLAVLLALLSLGAASRLQARVSPNRHKHSGESKLKAVMGEPWALRAARLQVRAGPGTSEHTGQIKRLLKAAVREPWALRAARLQARSGPSMPGGLYDSDQDDPYFKDAVEFAVDFIEANDGSNSALRLGSVVEAQQQVVAGILYHLTLTVDITNCPDGSLDTDDPICVTTHTQQCDIRVLEQLWMPDAPLQTLESFTCTEPQASIE